MEDGLAGDLVAMWQSELTAMAADRELRESWAAIVALWAQTARASLQTLPRAPHELSPGSTAAAQPPGAAAAAAASQPGLAEIKQLNRRIVELEQRLAELERGRTAESR